MLRTKVQNKKPKKLRIGILSGGPSSEHEVSIRTGENVFRYLNRAKYIPVRVTLSRHGQWFLNDTQTTPGKVFKSCDIIFNALHGTYGEDGKIQALFDHAGVRYTGSGIAASALAMDKYLSREIFKLAGFDVPRTLRIRQGENYPAQLNFFVTKIGKSAVVVKPNSNGSSVGITVVHSPQEKLTHATEAAFAVDREILVEEFIKGIELTCGVLDSQNSEPSALPVTEIVPSNRHDFFNYKAKYQKGGAQEITPARLDEKTTQRVQFIATRAHRVLGCRGYSRTDFIYRKEDDAIFVLETNTLPGLTSASLLPKAAQAAGISFTELLDRIIDSA